MLTSCTSKPACLGSSARLVSTELVACYLANHTHKQSTMTFLLLAVVQLALPSTAIRTRISSSVASASGAGPLLLLPLLSLPVTWAGDFFFFAKPALHHRLVHAGSRAARKSLVCCARSGGSGVIDAPTTTPTHENG